MEVAVQHQIAGRMHTGARADRQAVPCNVILYEDGDSTVVVAVDPMETIAKDSAALRPIAEEVRAKLARVLDRLA